jgi:hypothetical protein
MNVDTVDDFYEGADKCWRASPTTTRPSFRSRRLRRRQGESEMEAKLAVFAAALARTMSRDIGLFIRDLAVVPGGEEVLAKLTRGNIESMLTPREPRKTKP